MKFFNRKEEVMDFQLTQEGKRQLAGGTLKPTYYEFYDDDITYDVDGSSPWEAQNSSEDRIKTTPRFKTQYLFHGVNTEFQKHLNQDKDNFMARDENWNPLKSPLGMADFSSNYAPAWEINFLAGRNYNIATAYTSSADMYEKIPQINCELEYFIKTGDKKALEEEFGILPTGENFESDDLHIFDDGTFFTVQPENNFILEILEENTIFDKENFDIEVFLVEHTGSTNKQEMLIPLNFSLQENMELFPQQEDEDLNSEKVEYFIDVKGESEMDPELIEELESLAKFKSRFDTFEKADYTKVGVDDNYTDQPPPKDIKEPC